MEYVDDLVLKYKLNNDSKVMAEILDRYKPLIGSTVMKYSVSKIPTAILEGEAKVIVAEAVNSFNPGSGFFATHVKNHMKGMNRIVNNANPFYIPQDRSNKFTLFVNVRDNMEQQLKRPPTHDELADELNWNAADVSRMEIETGKKLLVGGEIEDSLKDAFFQKDNFMEFIYNKLNEKHKLIMELVFGLHGEIILSTDRQIADRVGVSQTMVRKMKDKIIDTIKEYK